MGHCDRCGLLKTAATGALSEAHRLYELARKTTHRDDLDHFIIAAEKQLERARIELEKESAALRTQLATLRPQPPAHRPAKPAPAPGPQTVRAPFPEEMRALARTLKINRPFRRPPGPDPIWSYRPIRHQRPWSVAPPAEGDLFALAKQWHQEPRPVDRPIFQRQRTPGHDVACVCSECVEAIERGDRPSIH